MQQYRIIRGHASICFRLGGYLSIYFQFGGHLSIYPLFDWPTSTRRPPPGKGIRFSVPEATKRIEDILDAATNS